MPTYEYRCNECGHEFELFQNMSDAVKRKCPECGKNALERLIGTGAAVIFKGSGFYQTDYRSETYRKAAKAESGTGDASSEAKSDAGSAKPKPEKKSETKTSNPKPKTNQSSGG